MAQQMHVSLIDDLDPEQEADETVRFSLDGVEYEIDLSEQNAERLREALTEFVDHARRTGGRVKKGRISASTGPKGASKGASGPSTKHYRRTQVAAQVDAKAVREWAAQNRVPVADRGRIPSHVIADYKAAHNIA